MSWSSFLLVFQTISLREAQSHLKKLAFILLYLETILSLFWGSTICGLLILLLEKITLVFQELDNLVVF